MDCPRWLSPWQSLPYQKRGLTLAQCSVALAVRYMCYLCTSAFSRSPCVRRPCTLASEMWRAWSLASPSSLASLFDRTCARHAVQPCWPPQVALCAHLHRTCIASRWNVLCVLSTWSRRHASSPTRISTRHARRSKMAVARFGVYAWFHPPWPIGGELLHVLLDGRVHHLEVVVMHRLLVGGFEGSD
jgi:hypothetical protein